MTEESRETLAATASPAATQQDSELSKEPVADTITFDEFAKWITIAKIVKLSMSKGPKAFTAYIRHWWRNS